jgi:hypothetical protein
MLSHSSHILQPPDIAYFSPLKAAYGKLVDQQAQNDVFYISKADFLHTYIYTQQAVHSGQTIISRFHAIGLISLNPEHVLSALTITKTPSPPSSSHSNSGSPWKSETPRNQVQINKQIQLVQNTYTCQS